MILVQALLAPLAPSALALSGASLDDRSAPLLGEIREAILKHFRQFKADLAGDPQLAEHIYQIVNSTITA
jgi:hypothetical protein